MVFSSLVFLNIFLPVLLVIYFISVSFSAKVLKTQRLNNFVLLIASSVFYAWGAPKILPLLIFSSLIDYFASKEFIKQKSKLRRPLLVLALSVNILSLLYYKYTGFLLTELSSFGLLNKESINQSYFSIILPIGISFFTFQKISYLLDVWQKRAQPPSNFLDYLLFVICFPQLIAGPIVRFHSIANEIKERSHSFDKIFQGSNRFLIGLGKKVLIANELGAVSDKIFSSDLSLLPAEYAWFGIVCYSLQIYFDFSGYSDMAIGLGLILGFKFPENFNNPYISQNISEFWRRWHITLSEWMKLYLYIPLGGNRMGISRTYFNLCLVFLLSGLWHGASWNFLAWGAFHGAFLILDRIFLIKLTENLPKALSILLNYIVVLFSWVLFRVENLSDAIVYWKSMIGAGSYNIMAQNLLWSDLISGRSLLVFLIAIGISFAPAFKEKYQNNSWQPLFRSDILNGFASTACLILCLLSLISSHFNPFIYFRF